MIRDNNFKLVLAAVMVCSALAVPAAYAQQMESLGDWHAKDKAGTYAPPLKPKSVMFGGLFAALHDGQYADAADEPAFVSYYQQQVFPKITHPEVRGTRDDVIAVLRRDFAQLNRHPGSPVAQKLAQITLEYMTAIATDGKWHPSVREAAVLAMGEVKSPQTVGTLMDLIHNNKLHTMFKIVAMTDLVHLAEEHVLDNPQDSAPVVKLMAAVAHNGHDPQLDYKRWLRGQAADVLAAIGSTGEDNAVPEALFAMLGDKELPLPFRSKAARALGRLKYDGGVPAREAYAKAIAAFGSDALSDEVPVNAFWLRTFAHDVVEGLQPLARQSPDDDAKKMYVAAIKLEKAVASPPAVGDDPPPKLTEEDLKTAIDAARPVFDAAAGKGADQGGDEK